MSRARFALWASQDARGLLARHAGHSLHGFDGGKTHLDVPAGSTSFGFLSRGSVELSFLSGPLLGASFPILAGMYFSAVGPFSLDGGDRTGASAGFVVNAPSFSGQGQLAALGGPIEARGRLKYIDGCTDSLLVSPPRLGDPCFNHLHFPGGIEQTAHTHPSARVGCVARGRGVCLHRAVGQGEEGEGGEGEEEYDGAEVATPLLPGSVFEIPAHCSHRFRTDEGQSMDVIAWHPDSDFGPDHDDHPMVNRTMVDGVSAAQIANIRTGSGALA